MREGEKLPLEHHLHHPQGRGAVGDGEMAKWLFAAEASRPLILSSVLPTLWACYLLLHLTFSYVTLK